MPDVIERYLGTNGPCLSSEVSEYLTKVQNITPAAARQRVSRACLSGTVKHLIGIRFPRKTRFIYLQQQFGSPKYWSRLNEVLLETNTAYGLALAAIRLRQGLIPEAHFAIACGAPLKQKRHLSSETVFKHLVQAGLLQKTKIPGLGESISLKQQSAGHYGHVVPAVRARLITEKILLLAIRDWLRNLGLVSYDKVATREGKSRPQVGTFVWDLTAPSYLGCMVKPAIGGGVKPGFVACDVYLDGIVDPIGIKPFINKCITLRALRNIGACMQIFVADEYSPEAFQLLKERGIIPATPRNLFGDEVADGLVALTKVLHNAAETSINPDDFNLLFDKLGKIEGASYQLRGTLFEHLVAKIARKTGASEVRMNRIYKSQDGKEAEADVIAIRDNVSVTFIECKGYNPDAEVPDTHLTRWLRCKVPLFYKEIKAHPDWKNLKVCFEFWATGSLSDETRSQFDAAQSEIRESRYTIKLHLGPEILKICRETKDHGLITAFRKHFMEIH